ncbi:MAG: hypothetical protein R3C29_10460 [Dehalococcoidia bacterium]|nr:hypothetical protein [Dehalococcoidia bacterium]MCA9824129.1 hypothetical protein [Dehalococcoidia bacterium]MCA9844490.1 hypothetical protein [Dehalococcoidia bacterium]
MKSIGGFIVLAIFVALVVLGVLVIVDGYFGADIFPDDFGPDSWAAPDSWSEWRDITIVLWGVIWLIGAIVWLGVAIAVLFLILTIRRLLRENVVPAVDSLKGTLDNVKGTSEFVGETAVAPIVRVYSIVRGVRSGLGAVTGIGDKLRRKK